MATKQSSTADDRFFLTIEEYDRVTLELGHVESLVELFHDRAFGDTDADGIDQSLVTFLSERVGKIRELLSNAGTSRVAHS